MLLAVDFVMQVITRWKVLNCFNQVDKQARRSICLLLLHLPKRICKTVLPSVYEDLDNLPHSWHQIPLRPAL